jgi:outer membrane protein OmpA-like peptidoglycan-associated protein
MKLIAVVLSAGLAASVTGCATKKQLSRDVGAVNDKVENLSGEMEKTQQRVRTAEGRIVEVDGKAERAQAGAEEAKGSARQALTRAQAAERAAAGKIIYTVTLSNDKVTFPLNRAKISDDTKLVVDDAIAQLKAENKGVYFEIEGHTDSTGPAEYNLKLGEERALAVRNYLHDQHGIALNRIEVISYGEDKPIVDNKTRAHRAQNRRVVINVLE